MSPHSLPRLNQQYVDWEVSGHFESSTEQGISAGQEASLRSGGADSKDLSWISGDPYSKEARSQNRLSARLGVGKVWKGPKCTRKARFHQRSEAFFFVLLTLPSAKRDRPEPPTLFQPRPRVEPRNSRSKNCVRSAWQARSFCFPPFCPSGSLRALQQNVASPRVPSERLRFGVRTWLDSCRRSPFCQGSRDAPLPARSTRGACE